MQTVLLVEDDQLISDLYRMALEMGSYIAVVSDKGVGVLELVKKIKPDLIVLDLMMPDKSGMDVLKELKADETLAHIPVIMFSNLVEPGIQEKALAAGAVKYALKSDYEPKDFLTLIAEILPKEVPKQTA